MTAKYLARSYDVLTHLNAVRSRLRPQPQAPDTRQAGPVLRLDGMGKRAIVAAIDPLSRAIERRLERQPLAEHRIEQLQRGAAGGNAGRIGGTVGRSGQIT